MNQGFPSKQWCLQRGKHLTSVPVNLEDVFQDAPSRKEQDCAEKGQPQKVETSVISSEPLESFADRYEALLRVSRAIGACCEPGELFRSLARELRTVVPFGFIGLFLYDESRNKVEMPVLQVVEGCGFAIPPDFRAEDTITWWVFHNQQPAVISSVAEETRFPRMMQVFKRYGIQSGLVLPLTTARRRLGGLAFGSDKPGTYSDDEVRYLGLVADQVALALDNTLRAHEQRRTQMFLSEGEKLSRTGSWCWSLSKNEIRWSAGHFRLFGMNPEDTQPTLEFFWQHVHPEDREGLQQVVDESVREKCDFEHEFRLVGLDGVVRHVRGIGHAVVDKNGDLSEFAGTTMDITSQKKIEDDLRRKKAHLEKLFELAPEAIVLRDKNDRILKTNQEFTKVFGYSIEESLGRDIHDLIVPDEQRYESKGLCTALKRGERVNAEVVRRRKDGSQLAVSFVAAPVVADDREPEIYAIYRDISERKRAEELLRRNEAYLLEGQKLSHTGSWARSVITEEVYFSEESYRIYGIDPATKTTLDTIRMRMHPEDRESMRATIQNSIRDRCEFESDYRLMLDDGTIRYIHVLGHPVLDAEGKLTEFVGTLVDSTEQHESRAALEKAFAEIQQLKDQLQRENVALREEIDETSMFEEIVGKSAALREVLKQVETVAATDSTVLIYGETGTGKELIARAIHNLGRRSSQAFVKLNCAAIPTGLLESELFGHEKGAFTGAIAQRVGRFELANHGTVFLDEIGEIALELQPKLLRVLQEKEFERLGSSRTQKTDARLIAATNRDLSAMAEEGKFRSDLFYRLNVFPIYVPALRERREDIPLLVRHFVQHFARRLGKNIDSIPSVTMNALCEYHWPGNIRELQNVIERAVIVSTSPVLKISTSDLKPRGIPHSNGQESHEAPSDDAKSARRDLEETERKRILGILEETRWTVAGADGAAARLGMKRSTLQYRMRRLGIPTKRDSL
jgi:PAS domain S-box-containing protein